MRASLIHCGALLLAIALTGCGETAKDVPKLGTVTGVVTLDEKPLAGATVMFIPDTSRPSTGLTGADGKYTLRFNENLDGAAIGNHKVRITSAKSAEEPEKLPAKYNMRSDLKAVVAAGANQFNYDLKSK